MAEWSSKIRTHILRVSPRLVDSYAGSFPSGKAWRLLDSTKTNLKNKQMPQK